MGDMPEDIEERATYGDHEETIGGEKQGGLPSSSQGQTGKKMMTIYPASLPTQTYQTTWLNWRPLEVVLMPIRLRVI